MINKSLVNPPMVYPQHPFIRLAVMMVLPGEFAGIFTMLAPVCSSFSSVNLASSCRSILTPWGLTSSTSVRRGNKIVSRRMGLEMFGVGGMGCFEM